MSPTYEVELRADVFTSVVVEADTEEDAIRLAYEDDLDNYDVDFSVTGVFLQSEES